MNVEKFIASGILENYCMGFTTDAENAEVELNAALYPEIRKEIDNLRSVFEKYVLSNKIDPSPRVKFAVMESIYLHQAGKDRIYPPLVKIGESTDQLAAWISDNPVDPPDAEFDNFFMRELPSTEYFTNFIVWAKEGHETEMHTDCNEYLYVIKGSCTMYFEAEAKSYVAGDLICIPPHINHHAVVTSDFPMMALVQRQACA